MARKSQSTKAPKVAIGSGKRNVMLSTWQVLVVGILFGALGVYALMSTFAAPLRSGATISVNPLAPKVNDSLIFTGCGYEPSRGLTVTVQSPYATSFFGGPADANGCYDSSKYETYKALQAGSYTVKIYQGDKKGNDKPKAILTFSVN